jgi:hypothetical protein
VARVDLEDQVGVVASAGLERELAELVAPSESLRSGIRDEVLAEAIAL